MRKLMFLVALSIVPAASQAAVVYFPNGNVDIYGSYLLQKFSGSDQNPHGGGGGIAGQLNLPLGLFAEGMYQYNSLHAPQDAISPGYNEQQEQGRLGAGLQFTPPMSPITLFGKIDYVHYGVDVIQANLDQGTVNHDGSGYFAGVRTRGLPVNVWAQGGYLDLRHAQGQEYLAGLALPLGRSWPFGLPVELFGQFRYTHLGYNDGGGNDRFYDYTAGVRYAF
jgi:hypothetical protein